MIRIKDWSSYQSYKDRKPPWIRLHKSLLDNYQFHKMSVNARALLPMLWLLASEDENPVSGLLRIGYEEISFRLRMPEKQVTDGITECIAAGFLEEVNEGGQLVTDSLRNGHATVTPETETETETETDRAPAQKNLAITNRMSFEHHPLEGGHADWWIVHCPDIDRFSLRDDLLRDCRAKGGKFDDWWAAMQGWGLSRQRKLNEKLGRPPKHLTADQIKSQETNAALMAKFTGE